MTQDIIRRDPRAQCEGKHQFETPQIAHAVARRKGGEAYRCPHCGFYHAANRKPRHSAKPKLRELS